MKHLKMLIASSMVIAMCLSLTTPAFAVQVNNQETAIIAAEECIDFVEQELSSQHTDVISGLAEYRAMLQDLLKSCTNEEDVVKIKDLINSVDKLTSSYIAYKNGARSTKGVFAAAIGAISIYFQGRNDWLASELLIHAANNPTLDSTYVPINVDKIKSSKTWNTVRTGSGSSGSGTFKMSESEDLYYAINKFSWTRTSQRLKFEDRYDFAPGDYSGLADTAVNAMYYAQQAGELVPFYVIFYEQV